MAKRRKKPWGMTAYGPHRISIYKSYVNSKFDGLTYEAKYGFLIEIHRDVFEDPVLLDETLIHEFVHVLEYTHGLNWTEIPCKSSDSHCSQAVKTLGHGLAQMLRELRQV